MNWLRETDSPLGRLAIFSDGQSITALTFEQERYPVDRSSAKPGSLPVLLDAERQLAEYFGGWRKHFDLPLSPSGTAFQLQVWQALQEIEFGTTVSYAILAARLGNKNAMRAVGLANGRNPIAILIPCHRVIGANGDLTGYGGGLSRKRRLLELEGVSLKAETKQRQRTLWAGAED